MTVCNVAPCVSTDYNLIALIEGEKQCPIEYYNQRQAKLNALINQHGGILLRGFDIHSASQFNRFAQSFNSNLLEYCYRSSPRTKIGGKIYTSTEYPADRIIPLHNENSYTNHWPNNIIFYCAIAPSVSGGETPLASSAHIYDLLPKDIVEKFETLGITYTRRFIPGIDLSWQDVFQTDSKAVVEEYCKINNIKFIWEHQSEVELSLTQTCPAVLKHPVSHKKLWFNQAHLFHHSAILPEQQRLLSSLLGDSVYPRNTYYGDGSEIHQETIEKINMACEQCKISFHWQTGDILVLDNLAVAHGRNAYQGERKILVAMC